MPDIAMCMNQECPLRERCYRFKAEPNPYRQSYLVDMKPQADGTCTHFWGME